MRGLRIVNKYYRVRSQEQWDWLMKYFEKLDKGIRWDYMDEKPTEYNNWEKFKSNSYIALLGNVTLFYGDVKRDKLFDFIEVSKLMEDEKMEDYVTIYNDDLDKITDELGIGAFKRVANSDYWAMVTPDIKQLNIPKSLVQQHEEIDAYQEVAKNYPLSADDVRYILYHHVFSGSTLKVKMTQVEKDEFDALKTRALTLISCFGMINDFGYPHLDKRLHDNNKIGQNDLAQIEFARAWADPSLIEVIPEKRWNVKIPPFEKTKRYYCKGDKGLLGEGDSCNNQYEFQQFTADELKEYGLDDDMYEKVEVKEK